jgi:hypothetical protein
MHDIFRSGRCDTTSLVELDHRKIGRSHPWWLSCIVGLLGHLLSSLFCLDVGLPPGPMPAIVSTSLREEGGGGSRCGRLSAVAYQRDDRRLGMLTPSRFPPGGRTWTSMATRWMSTWCALQTCHPTSFHEVWFFLFHSNSAPSSCF